MRNVLSGAVAISIVAAQAATPAQSSLPQHAAIDVTQADFERTLARAPAAGIMDQQIRVVDIGKYNVAVGVGAKQGFSIPVHAWLRGRARPLVEDLLSPSSVSSIPFIDPRGVAGAVADHMAGRRSYGFELWGLAVLAAWHRTFVASPIAVPDGPRPRPLTL